MVSEYEKQRLKNIENNQKLLDELGLGDASNEIFGVVKKKPAVKREKKKRDDNVPLRRSNRNVNNDDNHEPQSLKRKLEKEELEREAKEKEEEEYDLLKRSMMKRDLNLFELFKSDPLDHIIRNVHHNLNNKRVKIEDEVNNKINEDDDNNDDDGNDHEFQSNRLGTLLKSIKPIECKPKHSDDQYQSNDNRQFNNLSKCLKPKILQKVTTDRIHSIQFHPEPTFDLIFAGERYGQLGIFKYDENGNDENQTEVYKLQPHLNRFALSCIRFDVQNSKIAYTASYDCTVRAFDFETGISRQIFKSNDDEYHDTNRLITHIDISPSNPHIMWISDNNGGISKLDLRSRNQRGTRYVLGDYKIGSVSTHPNDKDLLCTASNDRSIKIWDIKQIENSVRNIKPSIDIDGGLPYYEIDRKLSVASYEHRKAVTSAYYNPTGSHIVTTSFDNTLGLFDNRLKLLKSFKHNNETGRWLSVFRSPWLHLKPHLGISHSFISPSIQRQIEIWSIHDQTSPSIAYKDENLITAVPAVVTSKPNSDKITLAGGNASGKVIIYK